MNATLWNRHKSWGAGIIALVGFVVVAGLSSCQPSEASDGAKNAEATAVGQETESAGSQADETAQSEHQSDADETNSGHTYSPFGIRIDGYPGYDVISFKSVGLLRRITGSESLVFEGLAQSLRRDLESHDGLDVEASVFHDKALADPANHKSCEMRHIYVDVWHSSNPERLGYSMWSGCGAGDRFAWREVEAAGDSESVVDELRPMTRDMADQLAKEQSTGCFQRTC